ncbi:MAG: hypothetical protein NXI24_18530 [bacterium]|nr:hypothetical protein [bacterium]
MHWKLFSAGDYAALSDRYLFPWSTSHTIVFALQDEQGGLHRLTRAPADMPPEQSATEIPCGVYALSELRSPDAWRALLQISPAHRVDLAAYQTAHPEFPAETLLEASGGKLNFKSLSDWRELGTLDETSRRLGRTFDLPLNILRLWARLGDAERQAWQELFDEHPYSKNIIRDIIVDLYDLAAEQRQAALSEARQHADRWSARETRSRAYPAGEVRDLVRALRSPGIEALRRRLIQLRRELALPKAMRLDWPVDLEQRRLTLQFEFSTLAELDALLAKSSEPQFQTGVQQILDEL